MMLHVPALARPGDDDIPCVRAAGFHDMRVRGFSRIGRKSDASRIDQKPAIRHVNRALQMAVSAEHKPGRNSVQNGLKLLGALQTRAPRGDFFEQIDVVGPGIPVAEQDVAKQQGLRHRGEPLFVPVGEDLAVRGEGAAGCDDGSCLEEQSIAVAANARQMEGDEPLGSADGIERPLQVVAEVDDLRDRPLRDVGEHSLEGQQVAVDIRKRSDSHEHTLPPKLTDILSVSFARGLSSRAHPTADMISVALRA